MVPGHPPLGHALRAKQIGVSTRSSAHVWDDHSLDQPFCRYCWGSASETGGDLVSPCGCSGTTGHVHYKCLVRWVSAGMASRKQAAPTQCEICHQRWFGSSRHHELLLATAYTELQLTQLYSAAQEGVAGHELSAAPPAPSRPWMDSLAHGYWALALRPLQAAMLAHDCILSQHSMLEVAAACAGHAASWFAARMCDQWVRAYASVGRWAHAALSVVMFANGAGSSLYGWLHGTPAGSAAFHLRLSMSLPFFPQVATALAAVGALLPGRFSGADGMRVAALAPLLALKWALGVGSRRGWLLGALCRLLTQASVHLRAAVKPCP